MIDKKHIGYYYQGYTADTERPGQLFEDKFGHPPQYTLETKGGILVGPITLEQVKATQRKLING